MGLDLNCGNYSVRVGSYVQVAEQRVLMIRAALAWLEKSIQSMNASSSTFICSKQTKEQEHEDDDQALKLRRLKLCQDELKIWLGDPPSVDCCSQEILARYQVAKPKLDQYKSNFCADDHTIFFSLIPVTCPPYLVLMNLTGLHHWVRHSDCEGCLSPGQARDLWTLINLILPFYDPSSSGLESRLWSLNQLKSICETSVSSGEPIVLC